MPFGIATTCPTERAGLKGAGQSATADEASTAT